MAYIESFADLCFTTYLSYSYLESVRSLLKLCGFHLDSSLLEAAELLAVEAEHAGDLGVVVTLHVPVHVSHDAHDGSAQGHGHLATAV